MLDPIRTDAFQSIAEVGGAVGEKQRVLAFFAKLARADNGAKAGRVRLGKRPAVEHQVSLVEGVAVGQV